MSSQFGFTTKDLPDLSTGIQTATLDPRIVYAFPSGFHLASVINTATTVSLTPREVAGGLILQDPNGGAVTTTLPTAADMVAQLKGLSTNASLIFTIINTANAAETITVAVNTGITDFTSNAASNVLTIAQRNAGTFALVFTNVTPGSEAAVLYRLSLNGAVLA